MAVAVFGTTFKGVLVIWSYRFNIAVELVAMVLWFVGISLLIGRGEIESEGLPSTLLGFLVWFYASIAVSNMSWGLMEEAQAGTLEQMYMSPAPTWLVFLGRVLAMLLYGTAMVLIVAAILMALLDVRLPMTVQALPVMVLTLAGLFGLGFAIGGAALVFKRVDALSYLTIDSLLFLNGSFLPVDQLPEWLERFTKLLPTTQGIIVLREVVLEGRSLASVSADGSLGLLAVHSAVFLLAGLGVFKFCESVARRRGSLGQY